MKKILKMTILAVIVLMSVFSVNVYATQNSTSDEQSSTRLIKTKEIDEKDDYEKKYAEIEANGNIAYIMHKITIYNIIFAIVIIMTCIISLILNSIRKNIGKAIFSGVGIVVTIIAHITLNFESVLYTMNGKIFNSIIFFVIFGFEILIELISLVFCFSKKRYNI